MKSGPATSVTTLGTAGGAGVELSQQQYPGRAGNQARPEPPDVPAPRHLPQVEKHHYEEEQHHDRAGVDEHLNRADELRIEHHVERGEAEHGVDQPERRRHQTLASHEGDRRSDRDQTEDVEVELEEETVLHHSPLGSAGSHKVDTGCVCCISRSRS